MKIKENISINISDSLKPPPMSPSQYISPPQIPFTEPTTQEDIEMESVILNITLDT